MAFGLDERQPSNDVSLSMVLGLATPIAPDETCRA
jgi:hypothetical protein